NGLSAPSIRRLRKHCFIHVSLVADGSDPADRPGDMLVHPGFAWHGVAFSAFAGSGAIWLLQQIVPLRNRGASADAVEGLALAEAARLLRAIPVFRRRRQRHRDALSDPSWH